MENVDTSADTELNASEFYFSFLVISSFMVEKLI